MTIFKYGSFYKYFKIKALGEKVNEGILTTPGKIVVQEKVDGGNFGFYARHGILHFCTHNTYLTNTVEMERVGTPEDWAAIEPILYLWKCNPECFKPHYYYYGESMQGHTLKYPDDIPGCIGYDILDLDTMEYINWKLAKWEFEKVLNLPFTHVHFNKEATLVTIDELEKLHLKSKFRDGKAEGIVIKRYDIKNRNGSPLFAKIVDDDFKEQNRKAFGGDKPPQKLTTEDEIAEMYATPGRIEKMIHKMHDEGYKIEMPMMRDLFVRVVGDILEEEILSIYMNFNNINFKMLNKKVSKKCPKVLQKVMRNV